MSISDNYSPDKTLGNGSTTLFTGNWSPLVDTYMVVALESVSSGVQTIQTLGVDYTLSFTSSGYSVTMTTAPSSSFYVVVYRSITIDQTNPYSTAKGFSGTVVEGSFDKNIAICQDLSDKLKRTPSFKEGSGSSTIMPEPEAGLVIGWDSAATSLTNFTPNTSQYINISSFGTTLIDDSDASEARATLGAGKMQGVQDFRLSLLSLSPVPSSDLVSQSTIYCTPYKGNSISLYDGTIWNVFNSAQFSAPLGTVNANRPYDVFAYINGTSPALELVTWVNDSTRDIALAYQDGVLVKSGDATRKYLGSFYTTSVSSTEDSKAKRYVWNYYNRVLRPMFRQDSTASWAYTSATVRQANANAANQLAFMIGVSEDTVQANLSVKAANTNTDVQLLSGMGLDSTTAFINTFCDDRTIFANSNTSLNTNYTGIVDAGAHFISWLESSSATGTTTWVGGTANGVALTGSIMA